MLSVMLIPALQWSFGFYRAVGLAALLRALMRSHALPPTGFSPVTWLLIRVTWSLILIHLVEIAVWGLFYFWQDCLPDAESAFYFAGVTYTTVGYGDLVLPETVADARTGRGFDGNSHVRPIHRLFLRRPQQTLRSQV